MSPLLYAWWWPRLPATTPLVLMFHSVADDVVEPASPNNTVSPSDFEGLVERLSAKGYVFTTLSEAAEQRPRRAVVMTFDDGCRDNYDTLFPIVVKRGIKATCFVTNLGDRHAQFLSRAQMREMDASGRFEFGGHTSHHCILTDVAPERARAEVADNKKWIEDALGHEVKSFAYPCGRHDPSVVEAVREAGYRYAVTTQKKLRPIAADPLLIRRQIIPRGLPPAAAYLLATRGRYKL